MRAFLVPAVLIGAFFAMDHVAMGGDYRRATWQEAKHQGQQFSQNFRYWFRKIA